MSRKFSNVLVICALVFVIATLIAGTSLAVYHSIGNTVNAYTVFVGGEEVTNEEVGAYASVKCDSTTGADISVTKGHTQTATLSLDYNTNAYTFVGWFNGDKADYNTAYAAAGSIDAMKTQGLIVEDTTVEVSMEEDSSWCAIYQVVKYSVSYSYDSTPNGTATQVTDSATYTYGDQLKVLSDVDGYYFAGWTATVDGQALGGKFTHAVFNTTNTTIALTEPYEEIGMLTIAVTGDLSTNISVQQTTTSYTKEYTKADLLTMLGVDSSVAGYEYSLKDANGEEITTITFTEATSISYTKTAIVLTANVVADEASYSAETISFSYDDTTSLSALFTTSNWTADYSFWAVDSIAISYNQTSYASTDIDTLIAAMFANGEVANSAFDMTVVPTITKYLTTITFSDASTQNALYVADSNDVESTVDNLKNPNGGCYYDGYVYYKGSKNLAANGLSSVASISGVSGLYSGDITALTGMISGDDTVYEISLHVVRLYLGDDYANDVVLADLQSGATLNDLIQYLYDTVWTKNAGSSDLTDVLSYLNTNGYADATYATLTLYSCELYFVTGDVYVASQA